MHHKTRWSILIFVACWLSRACAPANAYTERNYRNVDPEAHFAIVCHGNKRTIQVPAEEWPEHKAHGDYRGPCRAVGPVGPTEPKSPAATLTDPRGRRARKAWSEAEWARIQAAKAAALEPTPADGADSTTPTSH